jgi:phosphoribosylamine--glycine ligase
VFHAGTRAEGGRYFTSGGRFLVVAASGVDLEQACKKAYESVHSIKCEGAFYRTDIGISEQGKALNRKTAESFS